VYKCCPYIAGPWMKLLNLGLTQHGIVVRTMIPLIGVGELKPHCFPSSLISGCGPLYANIESQQGRTVNVARIESPAPVSLLYLVIKSRIDLQ
jgi:hypothetical protein